jgi:hypothetical protein
VHHLGGPSEPKPRARELEPGHLADLEIVTGDQHSRRREIKDLARREMASPRDQSSRQIVGVGGSRVPARTGAGLAGGPCTPQ